MICCCFVLNPKDLQDLNLHEMVSYAGTKNLNLEKSIYTKEDALLPVEIVVGCIHLKMTSLLQQARAWLGDVTNSKYIKLQKNNNLL